MHTNLPPKNHPETLITLRGFIETSLIDWDGKVASVVFVGNCNFRCPFCHNAPLVLRPNSIEPVSLATVENFMLERKDFIDGVVITGGEPCLYDTLPDFCRHFKQLGFLVKVDTNGTCPAMLKKLINEKLVDFVAMDIKAPLNQKYSLAAGARANLEDLRSSAQLLTEGEIGYEFRLTVVPGIIGESEIESIGRDLAGAEKFVLQQFVPENCLDQTFTEIKPYAKDILRSFQLTLKQFIPNTILRGI